MCILLFLNSKNGIVFMLLKLKQISKYPTGCSLTIF